MTKLNGLCGNTLKADSLDAKSFVFQIPPDRTFSEYYDLGREIGKGSFGSVFECQVAAKKPIKQSLWQRLTSRFSNDTKHAKSSLAVPLACKVLSKARIETQGWIERFGIQGLSAALNHSHPNVVQYFQFLEDSDKMYVIMSRFSGSDLFDFVIDNRPLSEQDIRRLLRQILSAVSFVHSLHCIHRDIKTENFVFEQGKLKLVDFGSCEWDNERDEEVAPGSMQIASVLRTKPRSVVGTTGYCAPETFIHLYDEKVDVFSVGVILFILATGQMPFECRTVQQYVKSLENAKEMGLWTVLNVKGDRLKGRSDGLRDLLEKMLALDPGQRWNAQAALGHEWLVTGNFSSVVQTTSHSTSPVLCQCSLLTRVDAGCQTEEHSGRHSHVDDSAPKLRRIQTFGSKWF